MEDFVIDSPAVEEVVPSPQPSRGQKVLRAVRDFLETILLAAILYWGINTLSARIRVDGPSMEPNFYTGEFVLVNRLAYQFGPPQRGDVIVFWLPANPGREYIKRIVGLPGDRVDIRNRQVYINNEVIDEPYVAAAPGYRGSWSVPEGKLFVLGDNRNNSTDSHEWGAIPNAENIVGRAFLIYWPPQRWEVIEHVTIQAETIP